MRCLRILTMKLLNRVHNFFLIKFVLIFLWWMVVLFQFFFLTNNTTINILCIKILLFLPCDFWLGFEKCCCWISGKILLLILFYPFGFFLFCISTTEGPFPTTLTTENAAKLFTNQISENDIIFIKLLLALCILRATFFSYGLSQHILGYLSTKLCLFPFHY